MSGAESGAEAAIVEGLLKALKALPTSGVKSKPAESKAAEERDADSENDEDGEGAQALQEVMADPYAWLGHTVGGGG